MIESRLHHRDRVVRRNGSHLRSSDSRGGEGEAISKLRLSNATILVVTVDNGVQLVTRNLASSTVSALQVLHKSRHQADSLAAAAVQREQLCLVSRGFFVLQERFDAGKAPLALLPPEVGPLDAIELLFSVCWLEEARLPVFFIVDAVAVVVG